MSYNGPLPKYNCLFCNRSLNENPLYNFINLHCTNCISHNYWEDITRCLLTIDNSTYATTRLRLLIDNNYYMFYIRDNVIVKIFFEILDEWGVRTLPSPLFLRDLNLEFKYDLPYLMEKIKLIQTFN